MRIVLTLKLQHRRTCQKCVTYKETSVVFVCIMNHVGIAMGLQWDCNGIETLWDFNEK